MPDTSFSKSYEEALLDSLILYESLKPVHHFLQLANENLRKENQALRNQITMLRLQARLQAEMQERSLFIQEKKRRRQRWLDRTVGVAVGLLF